VKNKMSQYEVLKIIGTKPITSHKIGQKLGLSLNATQQNLRKLLKAKYITAQKIKKTNYYTKVNE
jgi:DNA-binding MarR family transcriptional regulator